MFKFANPEYLYLLVLVPVLVALKLRKRMSVYRSIRPQEYVCWYLQNLC